MYLGCTRYLTLMIKAESPLKSKDIVFFLALSGGTNDQLQDVLRFVDSLRIATQIPVETWDERFTSSLAEKGSKRGASRDAVAACYMLQNYLDGLSNRG